MNKNSPITIFLASFFVYFAVQMCTQTFLNFGDAVQIRPVSALGPILGFFFGLPAIFGCATANLLTDFLDRGNIGFLLLGYFVMQVVYNGILRWVWYFIYRKSDEPYPRLDSAYKTALYMLLALVDSVVVNGVNLYVLGTTTSVPPAVAFGVRSLNNVWMLLYLGIPLLYALERSTLAPTPPPWVHVMYVHRSEPNLAQRVVITFTLCVAALLLLVALVLAFADAQTEISQGIVRGIMYAQIATLALPVFIPMFVFLRFLEKRLIRPIEQLSEYLKTFVAHAQEITNNSSPDNNEDDPLDSISNTLSLDDFRTDKPVPEVADLVASTNKMQSDLHDLNTRMYAMLAHEQRRVAELDIASQIQMGAVPTDFSEIEQRFDLDIAATMTPAREVGGDFYDIFEVGEDKVAFIIGDVSGKGVPAALFMMRAQNTIRQNIASTPDLGKAITNANNQLCARNDACLFVTAFACVLDVKASMIRYVNAGHNSPVIARQDEKAEIATGKHGLVLGAMDGIPYVEKTANFSEGDSLILYTDGITEATNEQGELFGEDRMLNTLNNQNFNELCMDVKFFELIESVNNFAGDAPQADDITAVGFCWNTKIKKISFDAELRHLEELNEFLSDVCKSADADARFENELLIVAEEVFTNICTHGFDEEDERKPIKVIADLSDKNHALKFTFMDSGHQFNPLRREISKADPNDETRKGGLGILLLRKYTADLSYSYANGYNILSMSKSLV